MENKDLLQQLNKNQFCLVHNPSMACSDHTLTLKGLISWPYYIVTSGDTKCNKEKGSFRYKAGKHYAHNT